MITAYQESRVLTASPAELTVMLYDGAVRFLRQATILYANGDANAAALRIGRADAILDELLGSLNEEASPDMVTDLRRIYLFCKAELVEARRHAEADQVTAVASILADLADAWRQIATGNP